MMNYRYPTAFSSWADSEKQTPEEEAIYRVVKSRKFTMGPEVAALEKEFAEYHGMKYGIMVNSGSSANLIAVAALYGMKTKISPDIVGIPAIAWSTTYAPFVQYRYRIQLLDVDDTWNAPVPSEDTDDLPDMVVGCSILGNPGYLKEWQEFCQVNNILFMEDNCESLGAYITEKKESSHFWKLCGTYGKVNTFSFFYSHQISAIEGGMILTDDFELASWCRVIRAHGWTRDTEQPKSFEDEYNFVAFGYNVRPVEIHAAIAREQLKALEGMNWNRQQNYNAFCYLTQNLPIKLPRLLEGSVPNPFGLAFTVENKEQRTRLVQALRAKGIDCRLPTGGSFLKHRYGKSWSTQETPNADRIHETGLFLGNAPFDITHLIEEAVNVMKEVL